MEVHHHPHSEKKGLKEYLLEGLMIFLAVSMGFIAENIREKFIENERAHELAESLYQEVYADSVKLQKISTIRDIKEKALNNLINYFKDSSLINTSHHFYRKFTWTFVIQNATNFEPADGILTQLRNSGSLRYFKNNLLQKECGELSVAIAKIRNREEFEVQYFQQYVRPVALKFYNFGWYDEISKQGTISIVDAMLNEPDPKAPPIMSNASLFNKTEIKNLVHFYLIILRTTRISHFNNYLKVNHNLLATLRKEYNLKAE